MELDELNNELANISSQINALTTRRWALKAEFAAEHAPLKIGQLIKFQKGNGWAKGRVEAVEVELSWRSPRFEYVVTRILKDGRDGKRARVASYSRPEPWTEGDAVNE